MTGEDTQFDLYQAVKNLLKSEIYYTRLRRTLKNGWDPKVLTDFLVMDDLVLVARDTLGNAFLHHLEAVRGEAFAKALESALRLDVRVHDKIRKLEEYLRSGRPAGIPADQVFDKVYGKSKYPVVPSFH